MNSMNELQPLKPRTSSIPASKEKIPKTPKKNGYKVKDYATQYYLNQKRVKVDPLRDVSPRRKGVYTLKKEERKEVREILYPFIHNFIATNISFKKMPKMCQNDVRSCLVNYFNSKFKNTTGSNIMKLIVEKTNNQFTQDEILNTLISIIYKNRLDYLSFIIKKGKPVEMEKPAEKISLWDKISEHSHV